MRVKNNRRVFMGNIGAATVGGFVGLNVPFARHWPEGLIPLARAQAPAIVGKIPEMVLLNDRPLNAETPAHFLDDDVTPFEKMFVRNNGVPPPSVDPMTWSLTIDGESLASPFTLSLQDLKKSFKHHTQALVLECGGNGRAEFRPNAKGNQWSTGAVSCAQWTGVRLKDVLSAAKVKKSAVYVGYYGADTHMMGTPGKVVISRGVPIQKALEPETLLAFAMNGKDIPLAHGAPLRLVVGGFPASASGKWLKRLSVRDRVHDGAKMGGHSYRVPCKSVAPGTEVADKDMCIIEAMPVKSLITSLRSGIVHSKSKALNVGGHAWEGTKGVGQVEVSMNFGKTWQKTKLQNAPNRFAWQRFFTTLRFKEEGYYEVWARATDKNGNAQPMLVPGWNPKGYLNNACHRVALQVVA